MDYPIIPIAHMPECYKLTEQRPITTSLIDKWKDETLLWVFYSVPQDLLLLEAVNTLYKRGWVFNKTEQYWFKRKS